MIISIIYNYYSRNINRIFDLVVNEYIKIEVSLFLKENKDYIIRKLGEYFNDENKFQESIEKMSNKKIEDSNNELNDDIFIEESNEPEVITIFDILSDYYDQNNFENRVDLFEKIKSNEEKNVIRLLKNILNYYNYISMINEDSKEERAYKNTSEEYKNIIEKYAKITIKANINYVFSFLLFVIVENEGSQENLFKSKQQFLNYLEENDFKDYFMKFIFSKTDDQFNNNCYIDFEFLIVNWFYNNIDKLKKDEDLIKIQKNKKKLMSKLN